MKTPILILLALLSLNLAQAQTPACVAGQRSATNMLILTQHTVAYAKPISCQPLNISGFSAEKGQNNTLYALNWSKQEHNLWYVNKYEVRINGGAINTYPYESSFPVEINVGGDLASFEVRACSSVPSDISGAPDLVSCGNWQSTQTTCAGGCPQTPNAVLAFSVYKDAYINEYRYNWQDNQADVTEYHIQAYGSNGNEIGDIQQVSKLASLPILEPFTTTGLNATPTNFKIRACHYSPGFISGLCSTWSDAVTPNLIPARVVNLQSLWTIPNPQNTTQLNNNKHYIQFNYPQPDLVDANIKNNGYFKLAVGVNSNALTPAINFNNGTQWQSQLFSNQQYVEQMFYVKTCIKDSVNNALEICGPISSVQGAPLPLYGLTEIGVPAGATMACYPDTGKINLNIDYKLDATNADKVNYFKIVENQPVYKPLSSNSTNLGTTTNEFYVQRVMPSNGSQTQTSTPIKLKRKANGEYSYSVRACQRDRINGDSCSATKNFSLTTAASNVCEINASSASDIPQATNVLWYDQNDNDSSKKVIKWTYPSSSTRPDYFYIKRKNAQDYKENLNGEQLNACVDVRAVYLDNSTTLTAETYSKFDFTHYISNEEHKMTNVSMFFEEEEYWSTRGLCANGININTNAADNIWNVFACQNGVGCSAPYEIDLTDESFKETETPTQTNGNYTQGTVLGGPGDLKPGVFWNPYQSGTGWHFYWVNQIKGLSDPETLASPYDLKAYWLTYREISGIWSPVWLSSNLIQKTDTSGNLTNTYRGDLQYTYKQGSEFVTENAGAIELQLSANNNTKATLLLSINYDGNMFTQDQVNYDSVALNVPDDYIITNDGKISIPIEDFALGLNSSSSSIFGGGNDIDHYSGAWSNQAENITVLTWIERNLELSNILLHDNQGIPLWLMTQSCDSNQCTTPSADWFPAISGSTPNFNTVTSGFNPLGYADLDYFVPDNVTYLAQAQRKLNYNNTSIVGSEYNQLQLYLAINIAGNSNENDLLNRATSKNINQVVFDKIASQHSIEFYLTNKDGDQIISGNTCDPNQAVNAGECTVHFNWFTTDDFPEIDVYFSKDESNFQKLSNLCGITYNDTDPYNQYNYQCSLYDEGIYQFELRKPSYSDPQQTVIIAESEFLEVMACTSSLCGEELTEPAMPPNVLDFTNDISADPASDTVGTSAGVFDIDESGSANYSFPIFAPAGRGGMTPQLALGYNSGAGNGIAGVGWNISGTSSITRCLKSPEHDPDLDFYPTIQLDETDALCLDGQRMFKLSDGTYRTELDGFSRITASGSAGNGPNEFKIEGKNGEIRTYGSADALFKGSMFGASGTGAQIISSDAATVHTWLINKIADRHNNEIHFVWDSKDGESYLSQVKWTMGNNTTKNHYQIDFNYSSNDAGVIARPDARHHYAIGTEFKSYKYLIDITTKIRRTSTSTAFDTVRQLKLNYEDLAGSAPSGMLRLASVEQCLSNGATCLQPVEFEWDNGSTRLGFGNVAYSSSQIGVLNEMGVGGYKQIDVNGDGINELLFVRNYDDGDILFVDLNAKYSLAIHYVEGESPSSWGDDSLCPKNLGNSYWNRVCNYSIKPFDLNSEVQFFNESSWFVYDFNADGYEDLLTPSNGTWYIYYSDGAGFGSGSKFNTFIPYNTNELSGLKSSFVIDVTNDGLPDLVTPTGENSGVVMKINIGYLDNNGLKFFINKNEPLEVRMSVGGWTEAKDLVFGVSDFNGDGYSDAIIKYREYFSDTECDGNNNLCWKSHYGQAIFVPSKDGDIAHLKIIADLGVYDTHNFGTGYTVDFQKDTLRFIDINGDGLTDMLYGTPVTFDWAYRLNNGEGYNPSVLLGLDPVPPSCLTGDLQCNNKRAIRSRLTQFVDYDLDGDIDVLYASTAVNNNKHKYILSKFDIESPYSSSDATNLIAWDNSNSSSVKAVDFINIVADFSGDGNPDYFQLYRGSSGNKQQSMSFGQGNVKNKITKITNNYNTLGNAETAQQTSINIDYTVATDPIVYAKSTGSFALPAAGNGSPIFDIFSPMYLVSSVSKTTPGFADSTVDYFYSGLKVQGGGRGSLGFREITTTDNLHKVTTSTQYRQDFPYIGMPDNTITMYDNGSVSGTLSQGESYYDSEVTYDELGHKMYFPYLLQSIEKDHNFDYNALTQVTSVSSGVNKTIINAFKYDPPANQAQHGNLSSSTATTCIGNASSLDDCSILTQQTTSNLYDDTVNGSSWLLGRLSKTTVSSYRVGAPTLTRISNFTYTAKGQLEQEIIQGNSNQFLRTIHRYNNYGIETETFQCSADVNEQDCDKVSKIKGRSTTVNYVHRYSKKVYESQWNEFVAKTQEPFGNYAPINFANTTGDTVFENLTEGSVVIKDTSTVLSRDIYGNPTEVMDLYGNTVATAYGRFGEAQATGSSLGSKSSTTKKWCTAYNTSPDYCPTSASILVTTENITGAKTRKYMDILGREIRSQSRDFNGDWTTVDTKYDQLGRTIEQTEPYTRNKSSNKPEVTIYKTTSQYDDMDRIVKITMPARCIQDISAPGCTQSMSNVTTTSYSGLAVTTINPLQQSNTQHFDQSGKVTKSTDAIGKSVKYKYDAHNNLIKTIGTSATISMTYDTLGRKTAMVDPDKGSWNYKYNAMGEQTRRYDNSYLHTNETSFYDVRGRMFFRNNIGEVSLWEYDTNDPGLLAKEYSISQYTAGNPNNIDQIKTFNYDTYKRPDSTVIDLYDGEQNSPSANGLHTYISRITYDQYGREFQSFDATGNGILNQYNAYGFKHIIRDAANGSNGQIYYQVMQTDARGNVTNERYYDKFNSSKAYEPSSGILQRIQTFTANGTAQDLSYAFDLLGNLIRRTDHTVKNSAVNNDITETFDYDSLNRLKYHYVDYNETPDRAYYYTSNGNLIQKEGLLLNYEETNNAGPHAITSTSDGATYKYDTVGNVTERTGTNPATFQYTSFDKPHTITANGWQAKIAYGANRSRYLRKDINQDTNERTITHYLGSVEYIYKNGVKKAKRYIGNLLITLENDVQSRRQWQFKYLLKDHIGSTQAIVDELGNRTNTMSFSAWGERQVIPKNGGSDGGTTTNFDIIQINDVWNKLGAQIENSTTRGFTGHEHFDQVGIIHMNGRIYDPSIGRFLQADPLIQDPYNTQSLNRYSYVMNNPLSYTDPSGYARLRKGWWRVPLAIAVTVYTAGAASAAITASNIGQAFAISVSGGFVSGGIATGTLKGAVKGGIIAAITFGIGHGAKGIDGKFNGKSIFSSTQRTLLHSVVSGVSAEIDGGKFGNGFISALLSQNIGKGNIFNPDKVGGLAIVTNAILQGSISEATGGKFANGAMSAAFRVAFNDFLFKNGFENSNSEYKAAKRKQLKAMKNIDKFIKNNPGKPIPVSSSDFFDISFGTLADISIDSFHNNPYFDTDIQSKKGDTIFFDDEYRDKLFLIDGLDTNNGVGIPGSYVNYIGIGMFTQRGGLSKDSIYLSVGGWNTVDIVIKGQPVLYNVKQIYYGIRIANIGFDFAKDNE